MHKLQQDASKQPQGGRSQACRIPRNTTAWKSNGTGQFNKLSGSRAAFLGEAKLKILSDNYMR